MEFCLLNFTVTSSAGGGPALDCRYEPTFIDD